jgi:hypothetical protein
LWAIAHYFDCENILSRRNSINAIFAGHNRVGGTHPRCPSFRDAVLWLTMAGRLGSLSS